MQLMNGRHGVRNTAIIVGICTSLALTACSSAQPDTEPSATASATPPAENSVENIVNTWVGPATDITKIPMGDGKSSTSKAAKGKIFVCQAGQPNAPGAFKDGPWINGSTWNLTEKIAVDGAKTWPSANFTVSSSGDTRTIKTNGLPVDTVTGVFPISSSSEAYEYDRNPNKIAKNAAIIKVPTSPTPAKSVNCVPNGPVGVLLNGVFLFNGVDAGGKDAVAHEVQDSCDGHPQQGNTYHYHNITTCIQQSAPGVSTLVGWAGDGYPIVLERDASGAMPTNADLDKCHGRTSPVLINGDVVNTYHYSATIEYPYTIGCFRAANKIDSTTGQ